MTASEKDYEYCSSLLADGDRDRWLAALFVPQDHRKHVHALYAFAHEIERAPSLVSDPKLGEIRLQWWREVLEGERAGEAALNPSAAALLETMRICGLPARPLIDLIEAHRFDLYADPMPRLNDLEGWCGETNSSLFRLVAMCLERDAPASLSDACGHAGVAYGMAKLLTALPLHARRHQCFLPGDILAAHGGTALAVARGEYTPGVRASVADLAGKAHTHFEKAQTSVAGLPLALAPAFVPLAVVPVYLKAVLRSVDPFAAPLQVAQWRRQWAMWRWR